MPGPKNPCNIYTGVKGIKYIDTVIFSRKICTGFKREVLYGILLTHHLFVPLKKKK